MGYFDFKGCYKGSILGARKLKKPLFKGFFDCFRLFPLDCTDRFIGEIPEHSVDARYFLDDPVSDPV